MDRVCLLIGLPNLLIGLPSLLIGLPSMLITDSSKREIERVYVCACACLHVFVHV